MPAFFILKENRTVRRMGPSRGEVEKKGLEGPAPKGHPVYTAPDTGHSQSQIFSDLGGQPLRYTAGKTEARAGSHPGPSGMSRSQASGHRAPSSEARRAPPVASRYTASTKKSLLGIPVTRGKGGYQKGGQVHEPSEDRKVGPQLHFQRTEAPSFSPGLHPGPAAQKDQPETGKRRGRDFRPGWKCFQSLSSPPATSGMSLSWGQGI